MKWRAKYLPESRLHAAGAAFRFLPFLGSSSCGSSGGCVVVRIDAGGDGISGLGFLGSGLMSSLREVSGNVAWEFAVGLKSD
jgi:hypothetical protein